MRALLCLDYYSARSSSLRSKYTVSFVNDIGYLMDDRNGWMYFHWRKKNTIRTKRKTVFCYLGIRYWIGKCESARGESGGYCLRRLEGGIKVGGKLEIFGIGR